MKRWFIPAAARARGQSNDLNRGILASNLFNCHNKVINAPPIPSISRCIHIVYRHKNVWEYQWSNFIYNCMSTFHHYVRCKDALLDCSAPGGERCESLTWVDEIAWCCQETNHCPNQSWTRHPFHERFSIVIHIQRKIGLCVTPSLGTISLQNVAHSATDVAHVTTVQLSCHVQNSIVITLIQIQREKNEISIELELPWIYCSWKWAPDLCHHTASLCYNVAWWHQMVTQNWVDIVSVNCLLTDGTNPLPEPILMYHL